MIQSKYTQPLSVKWAIKVDGVLVAPWSSIGLFASKEIAERTLKRWISSLEMNGKYNDANYEEILVSYKAAKVVPVSITEMIE